MFALDIIKPMDSTKHRRDFDQFNRPLPSSKNLTFKMRLGSCENKFYLHENEK